MPVMNFDLEDGKPPVTFTLKEADTVRFMAFMAECNRALRKQQTEAAKPAVPERRFPMQRGPSIPWSLAELIYVGYAARFGRNQSLERLAERNGFSWREVEVIYGDPIGRRAIDAALSAAPPLPVAQGVPEGYALVPVEPTGDMQAAGAQAIRFDTTVINKLWAGNAVFRAMVAAAPTPPAGTKEQTK